MFLIVGQSTPKKECLQGVVRKKKQMKATGHSSCIQEHEALKTGKGKNYRLRLEKKGSVIYAHVCAGESTECSRLSVQNTI